MSEAEKAYNNLVYAIEHGKCPQCNSSMNEACVYTDETNQLVESCVFTCKGCGYGIGFDTPLSQPA